MQTNRTRRAQIAAMVVVAVLVSAGCQGPSTSGPRLEEAWAIDPSEARLRIGDAVTLRAQLDGVPVAPETVAWSTSDPAVVTVDAAGVVTAVGDGQAVVTVRRFDETTPRATAPVTVSSGPSVAWTTQTRSPDLRDVVRGLAVASTGTSYVAGNVERPASGRGFEHAYSFVAWYADTGAYLNWSRFSERVSGIANAADGRFVIVGTTPAGTATVRMLAADATRVIWSREIPNRSAADVEVDGLGNVLVAGSFPGPEGIGDESGFVRKYDPAGTLVWNREFAADFFDPGRYVAIDALDSVYVLSGGSGASARLRKYADSGQLLWVREVAGDPGGLAVGRRAVVIAVRESFGSFGSAAVLVRQYSDGGTEVWTQRFGDSTTRTVATDLVLDRTGTVYVVGTSDAAIGGGPHRGDSDAFVRAYDREGRLLWTHRIATPDRDSAEAVAIHPGGDVLVAGVTIGNLVNRGEDPVYDESFLRRLVLW